MPQTKNQLCIPLGFDQGFLVLSNAAEFLYKTSDYWVREPERCIVWNDAIPATNWRIHGMSVLTGKDAQGAAFKTAEVFV